MIIAAKSDDSTEQNNGSGTTVVTPRYRLQNYDNETTVATTQSSGQLTQVHRQSYTQAELHERHEIVEVKGMVFLRRIRVFRMLHISGSE